MVTGDLTEPEGRPHDEEIAADILGGGNGVRVGPFLPAPQTMGAGWKEPEHVFPGKRSQILDGIHHWYKPPSVPERIQPVSKA